METKTYGTIKDIKLTISKVRTTKAKPITYAKIPVFDQLSQAVFQTAFENKVAEIHFGVEVREVVKDDEILDKIIKEETNATKQI